jgi:dTDP-4-amino-4,6-dideoxygalactose transaminase
MRIPFIDLVAQHEPLRPELERAVLRVMDSGIFVLGPEVAAFEEAFADYVGVKACVAVNSGTAALQLGLMALGLSPGDEVLIPANTFIATAEAVVWAGGKPVLVDVREDDSMVDLEKLEAAITPRTRGIIPVDLYGQPARLPQIETIAKRHGLFVLEDACQAHGASIAGRKAGSFGRAAAFSFYPGKNLGAMGEGGALVTDDVEVAGRARMLRDHGQRAKYEHVLLGHNYRLEALQGAVLGVKLPHLDSWNEARRRVAGWYREALKNGPVTLPAEWEGVIHVYHLFVVRAPRRDALKAHLKEQGIDALIHYPVPLHRQVALAGLAGWTGSLSVTDALAKEILSLPIFPGMTRAQVDRVADAIHAFDSGAAGRG